MGSAWRGWLLPGGAAGDGYWPEIKGGSFDLDLSTEQLAQKAEKLARSLVVKVGEDFEGEGRCCLTYWCRVCWRYGCGSCCCPTACFEHRLTVVAGEDALVSRQEGQWVFARAAADGIEVLLLVV